MKGKRFRDTLPAVKLIELLVVVAIISILVSVMAGPTCKAYSICKRKIKRIELKHNQDIMAAIGDGQTFVEVNGRLYLVSE